MFRPVVLSLFCFLFAGMSSADAGVMCGINDLGSYESSSADTASMSVAVATMPRVTETFQWAGRFSDSMTDLSGQVTSVSVNSCCAISAMVDNVPRSPQLGFRLLLLNSIRPPSPDLDGLIKPPRMLS